MQRNADGSFQIIRLDTMRSDSWAVVGQPSGAIALNADGGLIMRLERGEAQRIADRLNQRELAEEGYQLPGAVPLLRQAV